MAEGDKPNSILPQFVADVLRGVNRLYPLAEKIAAARQLVPEIARAGLDFLQRLKREEANPQDVPSAIATPAPVPPANPTIPILPVLRRAKPGEQEARVRRLLRKSRPPNGRVPVTQSAMYVWGDICKMIKAERETGSIPENEKNLRDPSYDTVCDVIRMDRGLSRNSPA